MKDYWGYDRMWLENYLLENGLNPDFAELLNLFFHVAVLLITLFVINFIATRFVIETFRVFSNKTKTTFDDYLVQSNFPKHVARAFQLLVVYLSIPVVLKDYPELLAFFRKLVDIFAIVLFVLVIRSLLRTTRSYLKDKPQFKDKPLDSYLQVFMIFMWAIGLIYIFADLRGVSVLEFAISLGAASAVLLLIFKDTILGLVASIQITVNDIVRIGDWISFSKFGADGVITEINLATVRVENWDHTFTTIPTYSLISDSFQNWRGMQESPGRRIKKAIYIKQNSVRFVTDDDLLRFSKISLVSNYLEHRQKEITKFNTQNEVDKSLIINGRNQTNLGIFRKYANDYIAQHPAINKDLMAMVRHLAPTPEGLPLEIYCFSKDKRWENYEHISADIFDHLIAAVPYFDLQLFESPSGDDITNFLKTKNLETKD